MQTIELPSPGTTQPTMFCHGVAMKNKEIRKIQFGGWSKRDYRFIRRDIERRDKKEFEENQKIYERRNIHRDNR